MAATFRSVLFLDSDCERVVFGAEASEDGIFLVSNEEDLDELVGFVAADAKHESDRRRQKRLDTAFTLLNDALVEVPRP